MNCDDVRPAAERIGGAPCEAVFLVEFKGGEWVFTTQHNGVENSRLPEALRALAFGSESEAREAAAVAGFRMHTVKVSPYAAGRVGWQYDYKRIAREVSS